MRIGKHSVNPSMISEIIIEIISSGLDFYVFNIRIFRSLPVIIVFYNFISDYFNKLMPFINIKIIHFYGFPDDHFYLAGFYSQ